MSIVNRRNAVLGWTVWQVGKRVGKKKAKGAAPSLQGGKPNKSLMAVGLAVAAGALAFLRGRSGSS